MPCCCPPRNTTEPMSTFTLKFLTAASEPVISWPQDPPSRDICVSCASARGVSRASTPASPTNCSARFKITPSILLLNAEGRIQKAEVILWSYLLHSDLLLLKFLINLRQLGQHGASLRLDVCALIFRGQRHEHAAHAAVGLHRLNQPQRFNAYSGISIIHERPQHRIADIRVVLHIIAQGIQRL